MSIVTRLLFTLHIVGLFKYGVSLKCYDGNEKEYRIGYERQQDCNTCICQEEGWNCTQQPCSDPCLSSPCANDGVCVRYDVSYECLCKKGYIGPSCELEGSCLDGEFVADVYCDGDCECVNGTVSCKPSSGCPSLSCDTEVVVPGDCCPTCWPEPKEGFCPGSSFTSIGSCENTCHDDSSCDGIQKCCFNGCGLSCADPQPEESGTCKLSPCKNGGTCLDIMSVIAVCRCLHGFRGDYCEITDGKACVVNGTVYRDTQLVDFECLSCLCNDGILECTDKCGDKPGECPTVIEDLNNTTCAVDQDCARQQKCCNQTCTLPNYDALACNYDGIILQRGDSYHEHCNSCTCNGGILECSHLCPVKKGGSCPVTSSETLHLDCKPKCRDDIDCNGIEKCCGDGCNGECMTPIEANSTSDCFFNNQWYAEDDMFSSRCQRCQCFNGSVLCRAPICPQLPCSDPIQSNGACCPKCPSLCNDDPCLNSGICSQVADEYVYNCTCVGGYSGTNCETPPSGCSEAICLNGGVCVEPDYDYSSSEPQWTCRCPTGFGGKICEIQDELCNMNRCQNGGTCYKVFDTVTTCACVDGFTGPSCEQQDICRSQPCLNGGTCISILNAYYECKCQDDFMGQYCEMDTHKNCSTVICENNGTCIEVDSPKGWQCQCSLTYVGEFCEEEIENSDCSTVVCQNGGECIDVDSVGDPGSSWYCRCATGTSGDLCEIQAELCDVNRCQNGGTCYLVNGQTSVTTCACTGGYSGSSCDQLDICLSEPCQNGGTCTPVFNIFYSCGCQDGFSGVNCEIDEGPASCSDVVCQNGGECIEATFNSPLYCQCTPEFTGELCEERGNLCDVNKCQNGGTCYKVSGTWTTCSCVDGFTGAFCDQQNICLSEPCQNGGSCINTFNIFYSCKCQDGFSGINCEVGEVPIELDCSTTECLNGGECIKPDDSGSLSYPDLWFCQCPVGFRGNVCEEQDELCGFNRCQNGGTCYVAGVSGVTTCACVEGFSGSSCEQNQKNCSIVGCLNKGSCIKDATDDWKCACPRYFSGEFCEEYEPCIGQPCENGGRCRPIENGYECSCPAGTSGYQCENTIIDPCFFSPCLNGGRCSAFKGLPDCSCTEGFTGRFCEISINETCPDEAQPVSCLFDPCHVTTCQAYPNARCKSNYCGGCNAEFYDEDGSLVNCYPECLAGVSVRCVINSCDVTICSVNNPSAYCYDNKCDTKCKPVFVIGHNELAMCNFCSNPLPCPIDPCKACTSIPRGAECRVDTCTSCIAELYDSDGTKIGECPDTMQECSPGLPYVPCLHDPCQGIVCPGYPEAVCKATYCGKCNYKFVDPTSGDRVQCNACPNNQPVFRCASDPCATVMCSAHPDAVCQVNQCGSCSAEFVLGSGKVADCTDYCKENKCRYGSKCHSISAGYFCECPAFKRGEFCEEDFCERNGHTYTIGETLDSVDECNKCICEKEGVWKCTEKRCGSTCIDRGQTYYAGDQRDSEDGCNTCFCTQEGDWSCTEIACDDITIVELTFHLDYNFANIEDDIETFKQSLRLDLAKQLSLPVTSLKDFRLSPGSIVVQFKLVSSDELVETDVTQVAADIVKQLDSEYIFTFDGQDIVVIPDTVAVISEPAANPNKKNNTNLELIIGVTAGAVGLIAAVIIFLIIRNKRRKECKLPTISKKTSTYPNANFVPDAVN